MQVARVTDKDAEDWKKLMETNDLLWCPITEYIYWVKTSVVDRGGYAVVSTYQEQTTQSSLIYMENKVYPIWCDPTEELL